MNELMHKLTKVKKELHITKRNVAVIKKIAIFLILKKP